MLKVVPHVEKTPMDRLRETIHENEALNQRAARIHAILVQLFKQQTVLEKDL